MRRSARVLSMCIAFTLSTEASERRMRGSIVAVLGLYGVARGRAFAPPSTLVLGYRKQPLRALLFSPERDDGGPIVTTASSTKPAAGWGSWEKVVSQRVEQEEVLKKLEPPAGLHVRTITKGDIPTVSRLCIDTFRGPFQWFELPLQLIQEFVFFGQIQGRLGRVTRNEIKHSMVIAEDTRQAGPGPGPGGSGGGGRGRGRGKVVGFLEIGMLPKPTSSEESAIAGEALTAARAAAALAAAAAAANAKNVHKAGGEKVGGLPSPPDTRLDPVAGEAAAAAAVEERIVAGRGEGDNGVEEGGEGEGRELPGGGGDGSTTAISMRRQPDVAYLANVVVDRRQRRRGIGRTMVNSAIQIVRELWPAEERIYVSVEQGNDVALALYQGMGFELAAIEDEMMARSRRRPPRIYLSKPLRD